MNVVKHIICELTGYRPGTVDVSQGDRGSRAVSCRLMESGAPWMIPEGATARVAYTLPEGTEVLYDRRPDGTPMWEIAKNIVTVELADQLMAQAGMVQMSILILGPEGGQLATWPIRVMVSANKAARLTVPEEMPPYGAGFAGKIFFGGADGTVTPLGIGDGVEIVLQEDGTFALVASGGAGGGAGYYTPGVSQSATGTMTVAFAPSSDRLPPVEPVTVALPAGPQGENGPAGPQGPQGERGSEGPQGPQGPQGEPGPAGADGKDGSAGPQGAPGQPGKTPVKGVDYFTEDEITEVARQAAGMVEVPDLPGSSGDRLTWHLVEEVTTTEEVGWLALEIPEQAVEAALYVTLAASDTLTSEVRADAWKQAKATSGGCEVTLGKIGTSTKKYFARAEKYGDKVRNEQVFYLPYPTNAQVAYNGSDLHDPSGPYYIVSTQYGNTNIPVGTKIKLYARY